MHEILKQPTTNQLYFSYIVEVSFMVEETRLFIDQHNIDPPQ